DLYSFNYYSNNYILNKIKGYSKRKEIYVENLKWNFINEKNSFTKIFIKKITPYFFYKNKEKEIESLIMKKSYDMIQVHYAFPNVIIAKKIKEIYGIPYVVTCHGSDINIYLKEKKYKKDIIDSLNAANKVIFVSKKLREVAIKYGYKNKNSEIIYNGIDNNLFKVIDLKKQLDLKESLNLPINKKIIGFVGNLEYVKGADRLSKIFYYINKFNKDIQYIVIGEGFFKDQIINNIKDYGIKCEFTGRIDQKKVSNYMKCMDLLVVPSRDEGFGNVIIEALACGTQVVATNVGGIPEAIIKDDNNLIEDDINFEMNMANAILKKVHLNVDETIISTINKSFTWNEIVKKEIEIYSDILSEDK
ncbi:glycosyltransferase family 4 protein, partial [Clostridium perfringens]|nr:glycosyltransferase family 4 protein [Clostridium perfringens]